MLNDSLILGNKHLKFDLLNLKEISNIKNKHLEAILARLIDV